MYVQSKGDSRSLDSFRPTPCVDENVKPRPTMGIVLLREVLRSVAIIAVRVDMFDWILYVMGASGSDGLMEVRSVGRTGWRGEERRGEG